MSSELARLLMKARIPVKVKPKEKAENQEIREPHRPKRRQEPGHEDGTASSVPEISTADGPRNEAITFMVTRGEKRALQAYARSRGMSFSQWARIALFEEMQRFSPRD